MDSKAPCFQNSDIQLADTRLVSKASDHPHLSASARNEQQHVEAIEILKNENDGIIFAWLKLARSLEPISQPHPDDTCLTRGQVRAITALRHCPSNDISAWLHLARTSGGTGVGAVSVSSSVHTWLPDQGHRVRPVPFDIRTPGPIDRSFDHEPRQQAATQISFAQPYPTATIPPPQAKPKYCCTLCAHIRPFKNQSDWKKHEKEHDTTYFCMLKGPRETTLQGFQCAFCGVVNPHDDHLLEHNAQACLQGPPDSFSSKRRHEMVNHLSKIHHVHPKSRGEAIAVKWKHTLEKQAWSCGFCVTTFVTFNDRLSHIATQHFEPGQTIDEWDTTKVIQGLLRQPGMAKAWEAKLKSLPPWEVPDIIWERDAIERLQHDLEVGPKNERSAVDLAKAAYIACRLNWGMENQRAMEAAELGPEHYQPLLAVQEFNEIASSDPATQAIHTMNYGCSSARMADLGDSNTMRLTPSPFSCLRTQPVGHKRLGL